MFYKVKMTLIRGAHIVREWFWRRKLARVKAEHDGDLSNVSPEVVKDLLGPISPEFGDLVGCTSAINSLSIVLNQNYTDWELFHRLGDFMHMRCNTADEEEYILNLIRKPNPRQVVLNELIKLGDVKEHQINYHKEAIDKWLIGEEPHE